jgi:hypothetical protein
MLQRFIEVYLPRLDPKTTDLLLLHMINPWGMKHRRRANANNVDLNRNFVWSPDEIEPSFNPEFVRLDTFINPPSPVPGKLTSKLLFLSGYVKHALKMGAKSLEATSLLGQYSHPKSIHYGGNAIQEETRVLTSLYREAFQQCDHILHLDIHTGWGPRYQMTLINSCLEERGSEEFSLRFSYPLVAAATPDEFYAMRGDMIDYVYTLKEKEFPNKYLYSTSFEFGTYGESTAANIRGLRSMILENQMYWYGAKDERTQVWVEEEFLELFFPQEKKWQAKAVADGDQAFEGILRAEGFIS